MTQLMGERTPEGVPQAHEAATDHNLLPLERKFAEQFPNNPFAQAVHLAMAWGLAAREVRTGYATRSGTRWLYGSDSQSDHLEVARRMTKLNREVAQDPTLLQTSEKHVIWHFIGENLRQVRCQEKCASFMLNTLSPVLQRQEDFITGRKLVENHKTKELRDFAREVCTMSELIALEVMSPFLANQTEIPSGMIDPALQRDFQSRSYWISGGGFSALPDNKKYQDPYNAFGWYMVDLDTIAAGLKNPTC